MGDAFFEHVTDELLELYANGALCGPELDPVEDHLLICRECRERITDTGVIVEGLAEAARALSDPSRPPGPVYFRQTIRRCWRATKD